MTSTLADAAYGAIGQLIAIGVAWAYYTFWRDHYPEKMGSRIMAYLRPLLAALIIGVFAGATAGMIEEEPGDPLFGGGSHSFDPSVMPQERFRTGVKLAIVLGVLGVIAGHKRWESRRDL